MAELVFFERWLHFLAGILWIGLLYYFNFVQVPALAAAAADKEGPGPAAIGKYVAPRALLWFRWAAVVTWVAGAGMLGKNFVAAFTFQEGFVNIGMGAWLGTIMLFNVWVLIWPNQKKVLGIVKASAEEIAKARRTAFLASRTNTMLSIPMLFFMASHSHGVF
ncbi:MAG TPA: urate hydroxylase PuuD [Gammaproteobacteria bacterium]